MVIVNHRQARHGDARAEPDSHPSSAGTRGYLASMRTNVSARGQPISARGQSVSACEQSLFRHDLPLNNQLLKPHPAPAFKSYQRNDVIVHDWSIVICILLNVIHEDCFFDGAPRSACLCYRPYHSLPFLWRTSRLLRQTSLVTKI
jgi:hypothetical protein